MGEHGVLNVVTQMPQGLRPALILPVLPWSVRACPRTREQRGHTHTCPTCSGIRSGPWTLGLLT